MTLNLIQHPVKELLKSTDKILKGVIGSKVNLIKEVTSLIPMTKGKKVRSTLLFLLSGMANKKFEGLPTIAASVELFHLSSLIHDDILDDAEFRRGEKTLNHSFGNLISVMGGDFLFVHSLELMNKLKDKEFLGILIGSTKKMVEGQLLEIENNFNYDATEDVYMEVIGKKTSSLFAGISSMASHVIGNTSESKSEFYEFGMNFGNIFQLSDDLLDIFSDKSGKDRFRDLMEGKITLPYILLKKKHGESITKLFSVEHQNELLEMINRYNIREEVNERVEFHYKKCVDFLRKFPESKYSEALFRLLDFVKKREY